MTWAATGAVRKTKKIPRNNRMLKIPSMIKKRKVPTRIKRTPIVDPFESACERVYRSGRRMNPIALKKLKMVPSNIKLTAISSI